MTIYARIQNGVVFELILPPVDDDNKAMPMGSLYNPELIDGTISHMTDVSTANPSPLEGWAAVSNNGAWTFSAPSE
jgi:hypothetical protein